MSANQLLLVCGAKVVKYFELSKSSANKNAIYANSHKWQGTYNDEHRGLLVNLLAHNNTSSQFLS